MSNHYHIVVRLNPSETSDWSTREIIDRWRCLYQGTPLTKQYVEGKPLTLNETNEVEKTAELYRDRLTDLSWFMKALNEPIAKMANREDECSGHFWESRFCSQALTTTAALMACMAYVDLNPVRAGIAKSPSNSCYTSFRERVKPGFELREAIRSQFITHSLREFSVEIKSLILFSDQASQNCLDSRPKLPFSFSAYQELITWTSVARLSEFEKNQPETGPSILSHLNLSPRQWLIDSEHFEVLHRLGAFTRLKDNEKPSTITQIISH